MAAPGYSYLTLGAARAELAARLEDPGCVFWTPTELDLLIVQAIRTWQALTGTYKQRAVFDISPGGGVHGSAFYSLTNLPNGILSFSVTDQEVIYAILAALAEPTLTATWTGTGQYSFAQVANAVQNRINRWLSDTGAHVTHQAQNIGTGPSASRILLPEAVLDVRRVAWQIMALDMRSPDFASVSGLYPLWRDDEYAMQAFRPLGSLSPGRPQVWGKFVIPPVGIEVYPPPADPGLVETLVVTSGPQVGTTPAAVVNTPTLLRIPDDFVWGIIAGALSDLCNADGPARDPARAQYAESRYQETVELYRMTPTLIETQINGVPIWSGSVFEMDAFMARWQATAGMPQFAGMAGRNLVAFAPTPGGAYSVTVDVVANIPVPTSEADYVQVDRGALNPLLDYAQHLACFKMGGPEFAATEKHRQNFYRAAAVENARITKGNFYRSALESPAIRQQQEVPRI